MYTCDSVFFLNFQIRVEVFKICKLLTHTVFIWMSCGTQFSLVTYMDNTKPKEGSYPTYTCTMNHWSQIKQQLLQHTGKNSRESRFTWYFSYEFHVKSSLRYKYVRYRWQQNFMWNLHEHLHVNFPKCTLHGKNFTGISHAAILRMIWMF